MDVGGLKDLAWRKGWRLDEIGKGFRVDGVYEVQPSTSEDGVWWVWRRGQHGAERVCSVRGLLTAVNYLRSRPYPWKERGPHRGDWVRMPTITRRARLQ